VYTALLIVHGLLAVALLGGLTHQAFATLWPARQSGGFVSAYRSVSAARFTNVNITLYVVTFALGSYIYPAYRIAVRTWIENARLWQISGLFEMKEQSLAIGLGMLPFFWLVWKGQEGQQEGASSERAQMDDGPALRHRLVQFSGRPHRQ
jgi:hypothetical protein